MNNDIEGIECVVIQKEGGEVRERGVGLGGSKSPTGADAGAPSMGEGEGAENGNGGWAMVTRRKSKVARAVGTSPQLAKTAKVFASSSELERKRKAEQSMADQIAALREMVLQLIKGQAKQKIRFEGQEARYTEEIQKQAALLKELVKESQGQQQSTTALEATVAKSVRKPSYSEVAEGDHTGTPRGSQAVAGL